MRVTSFGNCCGIRVISGFYGTPSEVKENLIKKINNILDPRYGGNIYYPCLVTIALNSGQLKKYKEVLNEFGFKMDKGLRNANSGNTIYLGRLNLNQYKKSKK